MLAASMAAWHLAKSNDAYSSKAMKVAEAKAVAALSRLTACEMELGVLHSKLVKEAAEMQVIETSKDAAFEEVEVVYLEQVEQMNVLVFKRGYDVGLGDAAVSEDSPLWTNYATKPDSSSPQLAPPEVPGRCQAGEVSSPMVGNEGTSTPAEPTPPAPSVP